MGKEISSNDFNSVIDGERNISVESLAQQWAKNYLQNLHIANKNQDSSHLYASSEITSAEG